MYVVITHLNRLIEAIQMSTHTTYHYYIKVEKDNPELSSFASWPGAMIYPQWLELPMSRTNFHGLKDVRAIEVRPCLSWLLCRLCSVIVAIPVHLWYNCSLVSSLIVWNDVGDCPKVVCSTKLFETEILWKSNHSALNSRFVTI